MFWKKPPTNQVMFSYDLDDQRASFRVSPAHDEPIVVVFGEDTSQVIDIGVGGFSCRNLNVQVGETRHALFSLPGDDVMISTMIRIQRIDECNACGCEFINLPDDAENAIHRYMLAVQKAELGTKKPVIISSS